MRRLTSHFKNRVNEFMEIIFSGVLGYGKIARRSSIHSDSLLTSRAVAIDSNDSLSSCQAIQIILRTSSASSSWSPESEAGGDSAIMVAMEDGWLAGVETRRIAMITQAAARGSATGFGMNLNIKATGDTPGFPDSGHAAFRISARHAGGSGRSG